MKELLEKNPNLVYINLDVIGDGDGSFENWMKIREAGLRPVPVWHPQTALSKKSKYDAEHWLRKYLDLTDHIAIGAIAKVSSRQRVVALDRIWEDYLIDEDRMPKVKVHGMGITSYELMTRYPWHSVDSTSWLQVGMYGKVYIPMVRNGKWLYDKTPYVISFSSKSPAQKEKGTHINNVTPLQRKHLLRYLKENGFKLGKSRMVDGEEEIIEAGVSNDYEHRCFLNAIFFAKYVEGLPWPRPFKFQRPRGLRA